MVWWGARVACAEVSTGPVEASKARLGFRSHMAPDTYGRIYRLLHAYVRMHAYYLLSLFSPI
jgi:hypothetical protein